MEQELKDLKQTTRKKGNEKIVENERKEMLDIIKQFENKRLKSRKKRVTIITKSLDRSQMIWREG